MEIEAIVGTSQIDLDGEQFSGAGLRCIADTAVGTPILKSFKDEPSDRLGTVLSARLLGEDAVAIKFDLSPGDIPDGIWYLVPAFRILADNWSEVEGMKIFDKPKVVAFALTQTPADRHLTPILIGRGNKIAWGK